MTNNYFLIRTDDGRYVGYWNGDMMAGRGLSLNVPRALGLTFPDPFEAALWAERINAETGAHLTVVDRDGQDMTAAVDEAARTDEMTSRCPIHGTVITDGWCDVLVGGEPHAVDDMYRCEFFGPEALYRVSTLGDETVVDASDGLEYRTLKVYRGALSHERGVTLALSLLPNGEAR